MNLTVVGTAGYVVLPSFILSSALKPATMIQAVTGRCLSWPPLVSVAGFGIRLVIVLGAQPQIDTALQERGVFTQFVGGYRVTDAAALEAAVEAAGMSRTAVEQYLSRVRSRSMIIVCTV